MKNEYLNEEKYQRMSKALGIISLLVLLLGLGTGGILIYNGVKKPSKDELSKSANILKLKQQELLDKGFKYSSFSEYTDGEAYDLKIITDVLNPSFNYCGFDEYKNNLITKDYCSLKNKSNSFSGIPFIMIGSFICFATLMIAGSIFMIAKGRKVLAFGIQQRLPVMNEALEKATPVVSKAASSISKDVFKSVAEGIKEGLKEKEK